jgi:hypothetical protein
MLFPKAVSLKENKMPFSKKRAISITIFSLAAAAMLAAPSATGADAVNADTLLPDANLSGADKAMPAFDDAPKPMGREDIYYWSSKPRPKKYPPPRTAAPRLFARIVFDAKHPVEGGVAFSWHNYGTHFYRDATYVLDAEGVHPLVGYPGFGLDGGVPLKPGEKSFWTEVTDLFPYGYTAIFMAKACDANGRDLRKGRVGHFTVEFSRNGKDVIGSIPNGGGPLAVGLVSLARGLVESDVKLSEDDLALAREAGDAPPRRPRRYLVAFSHSLNPQAMSPQAFSNEVEVMRLIGANSYKDVVDGILDPDGSHEPDILFRGSVGWSHMFNRYKGHICTPDYVGITNQLLTIVKSQGHRLAKGSRLICNTADEPYYGITSLTNCEAHGKTCSERFREQYGHDFVFDPAQDIDGYLDTVAYRDKIVNDFYKAMTDAARALHTNILTAANIGTDIVFSGNAGESGTSPFSMADAGALGIGQTEDWSNLQRTRQFCSYICDVYRSAYGRNGKLFEILCVMASPPETGAKAFAEVGHGSATIDFFHYGPHWLCGDNRNRTKGLIPAIRHFCNAVAGAEDVIVGAQVAKGDAALLFSESCDSLQIAPGWKRDWIEHSPYGKDRMSASLMLTHCGVRTDVLDEKDMATRLAGYKVLFATDRNIRRDAAEALADWMRKGGVVVRTRGALVADERDKPLPDGFFSKAGKIVELDFSPWLDYVKDAPQADKCYSHRAFDGAVRDKMAKAAREAGVIRRLFTDEPLVEASLLENGDKAVIALSNWSTNAHPRVSVTLEKAPAGEIRSASGATVTASRKGDRLEASLEIGWGDFLVLE